jgi:octaprenyl-diphosphate synthase
MYDYKNKAITVLNNFPKNKYRDSLELMVNYVVEIKV